jgi:polysaccharide export outer membrane protein
MEHLFWSLRIATLAPSWPILLASALLLLPTPAIGEYKLQSGDILEISVTAVPDLKQRAPIGVDGEIALPLVGQIKVGGLSISEARAKITQDLSNKVYRQSTIDGREIPKLILPEEIVVTAVEYRPIYVNGDVARPGEHAFRPGMTVRHAIAIAGGYDLMQQSRLANPLLQAADFRAEYQALWAEFATQQARIWRLRTELGEQPVEYKANKVPVPAAFVERLMQAETEHLRARLADRAKDKGLFGEAIKKADLQLDILAEKKKHDEEGNKADSADFQKVKELFEKGMTPTTRLSDARRAALMSSNQLLQTIVETSNLERQRGEYDRQLDKIESQSRIDAWKELQDANLRVAQITTRLRGTSEKLMYTSLLRSQLGRGTGERPDITVHRKGESGPESLTANEDLELVPGDIVEVALKTESLAAELLNPSKGAQ